MKIIIRECTKKDYSAILALIKELALLIDKEVVIKNSAKQMEKEKDFFKCLIAENEKKEIIGIAIYSFTYYSWVGKSLYLDDLYVKKSYRNNKIGTKLIKEIFQIAKNNDCKRLRWQVGAWNKEALKYYKKIGADIDKKTYNCDFDSKNIKKFLNSIATDIHLK